MSRFPWPWTPLHCAPSSALALVWVLVMQALGLSVKPCQCSANTQPSVFKISHDTAPTWNGDYRNLAISKKLASHSEPWGYPQRGELQPRSL